MLYSLVALAVAASAARMPGDHGVIPGQWIVVFHNNVTTTTRAEHMERLASANAEAEVHAQWTIGEEFKAYGLKMDDDVTLKSLISDPAVAFVEADPVMKMIKPIVHSTNETLPAPQQGGRKLLQGSCRTVSTESWGISRVGRDSSGQYTVETNAGRGVTSYVLDTGLYTSHANLENRATCPVSYIPNQSCNDGQGHGTHCACTVVATNVGVAQDGRVVGVKVLSNQGSSSGSSVINGLDFSNRDCNNGERCVVSMSLGGGFSSSLNSATNAVVSAGLVVVVAAGNDNANACNYSPASASSAITVGSTTSSNARSSFSNFGNCVDVFAPGSSILSCGISGPNSGATLSGTSMACPHIAGLVQRHWTNSASLSNTRVRSDIISFAENQSPYVTGGGSGSPRGIGYLRCA